MRIQLYSARKNRRRRRLPPRRQRPFPGYIPESLPEQTALDQRVLGFAYAPPLEGTVTSASVIGCTPSPEKTVSLWSGHRCGGGDGHPAFADGVVGVVAQSSDLGNYVTVDHPGGFTTLYAHCKCITASAGQTVRCGAILAQVGQTGALQGPTCILNCTGIRFT